MSCGNAHYPAQLAFEDIAFADRSDAICAVLNAPECNTFLHATLAYFQLFLEYEVVHSHMVRVKRKGFLPAIVDQQHEFDQCAKRLDQVGASLKGMWTSLTEPYRRRDK